MTLAETCPMGALAMALDSDVWHGAFDGDPESDRSRTRTVMVLATVDRNAHQRTVEAALDWLDDRPMEHGTTILFQLLRDALCERGIIPHSGERDNARPIGSIIMPLLGKESFLTLCNGMTVTPCHHVCPASLLSAESLLFFTDHTS